VKRAARAHERRVPFVVADVAPDRAEYTGGDLAPEFVDADPR
jgi:hypothetical protein